MKSLVEWLLGIDSGDLAGGQWRVGFVSGYDSYVRLGLLVLLAVLAVLTLRNYRREGGGRRGVRRVLAGLRLAVLVLVVVLLFQPAVIVRFVRTLHTTVVLLVDDSMSMNYTDSYAARPEERQALAEVLEVEPGALEKITRSEVLETLLRRTDMIETLRAEHPVEVLAFSTDRPGEETYTRVLASLPIAGEASAGQVSLAGLSGGGFRTAPARAMRDVLDRYQGRRIGAVVLLSDGQPTEPEAGQRMSELVEYARSRNVPRYALRVGDPTPPMNVAVTALRTPREIRAKAPAEMTVLLSQTHMAGQQVTVRLDRRGADEDWPEELSTVEPLASKTVTLQAKADEETSARGTESVSLTVTPSQEALGEYVYRATVSSDAPERSIEDNQAEAFVKVTDSKIRILLVSADAGWEFRYLRNYFLRQPELYRVSVWQQNADPEINQSASSGMKLQRLPRTLKELIATGPSSQPSSSPAEELRGYHVVILYDPTPTQNGFDTTFMENLYSFVTRHRGGLCYIASRSQTVDVLRDPAAQKLAALLPVTVARNRLDVSPIHYRGRPDAWSVRLSSYGVDHPVTQLEGDAEQNRAVWSVLPGLFWSQAVARTKPAARVLLEHGDRTRTTRLPSQSLPLLAVQTVGNGRVVYVGFDETWRWRYVEDGYYYRRFWSNVVRYLAPLHARQVLITMGGERFTAGEEIAVDVEAYDREFRPLEAESVPLTITDTRTGQVERRSLPAVPGKPGRFRATVVAKRTGTFEVSVDASVAEAGRVTARQMVVSLPRAESRRTEANPAMLAEAVAGQGRAGPGEDERYLFAAHEAKALLGALQRGALRPEQAVEEVRHTLWDTPAAWLLVVLLLAVEWFVRKRVNMA